MGAVADDAVEERLAVDALAHEPALHVGDRDDQGVDPAVADHRLQLLEPRMVGAALVGAVVAVGRRGHPSLLRRPFAAPNRCREPYFAVIPPSATSTLPVTNDDSSEARKSATLAISRGSPGRPIGWKESIVA